MGIFGSDVHHHHTKTETNTRLVPYEKTVHEHRAPTDESIRIYQEIEQKARRNIASEIKLNVAGIEVVGVAFIDENMMGLTRWIFMFKLNDHEHRIELEYDRWEHKKMMHNKFTDKEQLVKDLIQKLSEYLAKHILSSPIVIEEFNRNFKH